MLCMLVIMSMLGGVMLNYLHYDEDIELRQRAKLKLEEAFAEAQFLARVRDENITMSISNCDGDIKIIIATTDENTLSIYSLNKSSIRSNVVYIFYADGEASGTDLSITTQSEIINYSIDSLGGDLVEVADEE